VGRQWVCADDVSKLIISLRRKSELQAPFFTDPNKSVNGSRKGGREGGEGEGKGASPSGQSSPLPPSLPPSLPPLCRPAPLTTSQS